MGACSSSPRCAEAGAPAGGPADDGPGAASHCPSSPAAGVPVSAPPAGAAPLPPRPRKSCEFLEWTQWDSGRWKGEPGAASQDGDTLDGGCDPWEAASDDDDEDGGSSLHSAQQLTAAVLARWSTDAGCTQPLDRSCGSWLASADLPRPGQPDAPAHAPRDLCAAAAAPKPRCGGGAAAAAYAGLCRPLAACDDDGNGGDGCGPWGAAAQDMCEEQVLAVTRRLGGEAGVADIYHATFNGAPAAVKVLHIRESQEEPLAHATQMAVLSAVPHPAIVQAFAMWPDMALTEDDTSSSSPSRGAGSCASAGPPAAAGAAPRRLRLRSLLPGEAAGAGATPVNVILLELCDRGTLWDALATGALVTPAGDCGSDDGCGGAPDCGAGGGRACAAAGLPPGVTAVLCDVAAALQFLHSKQLAHGNVRSDNVLLKTEPARHLGVQAKLAGFGRARVLGQHGHATSAALAARACGGCGRPPPRVAKGSFRRLSWMSDAGSCRSSPTGGAAAMADDVYAFGALLLEALDTAGAKARAPGAPPCGFRALAAECLSEDAARRPSMAAALARLNLVAAAHAPQRGPCAAAGVGAHGRFVWCEAPAPPITWPDVA